MTETVAARSDLRSATVNEQFDTRDETGVIRRQKQRHLGHFLGIPRASHRDRGHNPRDHVRRLPARQTRRSSGVESRFFLQGTFEKIHFQCFLGQKLLQTENLLAVGPFVRARLCRLFSALQQIEFSSPLVKAPRPYPQLLP
jgi:hypothetical protein